MHDTDNHLTLAHLSDVHLPLVGFSPRTWGLKRFTGFINWHRSRVRVHRPEVTSRLLADMREQRPDHVAVTGDLTNLGLPDELEQARTWLAEVGPADRVSVVPGNHDVYVPFGHDPGIDRWRRCASDDEAGADAAVTFPYVRRRGRIALIGVCSAVPMPAFVAAGRVGESQLARLRDVLVRTAARGLTRVVMIHHPPVPGVGPPAKGLRDVAALGDLLAEHGAELVVYGHLHRGSLVWWPSRHGPVPVLGVPSASAAHRHGGDDLARYHLLHFSCEERGASIVLQARGLVEPDGPVVAIDAPIRLVPGAVYPVTASPSESAEAPGGRDPQP